MKTTWKLLVNKIKNKWKLPIVFLPSRLHRWDQYQTYLQKNIARAMYLLLVVSVFSFFGERRFWFQWYECQNWIRKEDLSKIPTCISPSHIHLKNRQWIYPQIGIWLFKIPLISIQYTTDCTPFQDDIYFFMDEIPCVINNKISKP